MELAWYQRKDLSLRPCGHCDLNAARLPIPPLGLFMPVKYWYQRKDLNLHVLADTATERASANSATLALHVV